MVPSMTMEVASLITPSPNTTLYSSGKRSWEMTCSAATESVAARMEPSARQSCTRGGVGVAMGAATPSRRLCRKPAVARSAQAGTAWLNLGRHFHVGMPLGTEHKQLLATPGRLLTPKVR